MQASQLWGGPALDLAVINATILTLDPERRVIEGGSIAVDEGQIVAAGGPGSVDVEGAGRVIDAGGKVLMPGFVNAHTHAIHNLLRGGLSDDRVLYDWLLNVLYPGVRAYTAEDAGVAARLFCVEAIRAGGRSTLGCSPTTRRRS